MSKRKNPFGVLAPVQLKVHVGPKEAATKQDMEEVYKKTRERLLGKNKEKWSGGIGVCEVVCKCCSSLIKTPSITCSKCHLQLCSSSCLRKCCTCEHHYCQLCTVLNYDTPQVRVFCFDCLSSFSFQSQ